MKFNIKKEFDEELKHVKGLMNESYNTFLIPMVNELNQMVLKMLKAEKFVMFMHNKDIDHLYSLSETSVASAGQFGIDSIRMKSNLGLAGKAFSSMKIKVERNIETSKVMIPEEKDLQKLRLKTL